MLVAAVKFSVFAVVSILTCAQAIPAAQAQSQAALVHEAFASGYGKALAAELSNAMRSSADPACLDSKLIGPDQLESFGLGLMVKWGTRMMETSESLIDKKTYAEKFSSGAELAKLQADNTVKRYLAIAEPMQQAKILDSIFEQFDRYVLIKRIKARAHSSARQRQ
jgi:hypothetical protein